MAHEYAMKHSKADTIYNREETIELAWRYADAMQAEADKRNNKETRDKNIGLDSSVLKPSNSMELEWQPDWSVAPESADYWAMDENGWCNWYSKEHEVIGTQWDWDDVFKSSSSFNYQGNWQESLRKRPQ